MKVEKLNKGHLTAEFDCGNNDLNEFLTDFALTNNKTGSAQTYVIADDSKKVVGFYCLAAGSVLHENASERVAKGMPGHPIPIMLLGRLAIDLSAQGKGLGKALLKDALLRTNQAADIAGIRALLVHAKDEKAKAWYEKFDFEPSPTETFHLYLLMKNLRALVS